MFGGVEPAVRLCFNGVRQTNTALSADWWSSWQRAEPCVFAGVDPDGEPGTRVVVAAERAPPVAMVTDSVPPVCGSERLSLRPLPRLQDSAHHRPQVSPQRPIRGFRLQPTNLCVCVCVCRFRCVKCVNVHLCQSCFLTDRQTRKHKRQHPVLEFCTQVTVATERKHRHVTVATDR